MNRNAGKGMYLFLAAALIVGLALVAGPVPIAQATPGGPSCTVGSGADYATISEALAEPGCTTINVAAGTYDVTTTIVVNRAVIISGPVGGGAIVQGTDAAAVSIFEIAASNVTIQNLVITHNALTPGLPNPWAELPNSLIRIPIPSGAAMTGIALTGNTIYVPTQAGAMSTWNGVAVTVGSNAVSGMSTTGNTIYNTRNGVVAHYNNSVTISNNTIYNTKGGIMQYTGSQADADNRVMAGNTWGTVHNEWDIVWNSGGGPYEPDYNQSVLVLSGANNGAYVISKMTTNPNPTLVTGNRSHIFVNAATGTSTKNWGSGNMNQPYATITLGTEAVVPGGTVYVAAGTYTENVPLNKRLSLLGAGSGTSGTIITNPSGSDSKIGVVQITASGVSAADPLLLKDLRIQPVGLAGISVGRFTEATGLNVSYLELNNVHVIGTNASPATEQERGFYVDLTSTVQNLVIKNSAFDNLSYGWYLQKQVSADASTVRYVNVSGTTFNHNNLKGIYAEKLSDAAFTGCTVDGNGFSAVGVPTYFAPFMSGIDINLKAGAYQNISIANSTITNNGLGGAKEGVGLTVKARNDGATYGPFPATLSNVQITNVTVTGNERGIRFGEPDKSNAGPTNAIVTNSTISGNVKTYAGTDGTAYGGLVNMTTALVKAERNWWGDTDPSNDVAGPGTIDYSPWLGAVPGSSPMTWYTNDSIQAAVNAAAAGDTINVVAGTYAGAVNIPASLTLKGAQYGVVVSGRTAASASESTIQGLVTVAASNVVVDGFTLTNPGQTYALSVGNHTPSYSVIAITHNIVDTVGAVGLAQNVHAIVLTSGPDSVTIAHNRFNNIKANTKSASAVGVLDSVSTNPSEGLVIQDNTFTDIASTTKGAYGVILNNKAGVPGAQIKDNTFSGLNGGWTHAIGLEGPTPNAVVSGNTFSGLTAAGADNTAIFFQANSAGGTVTIEHNQFNGSGYYGVAIHPDDLPFNYTAPAENNWWGAVCGPSATGVNVGTNVDYSPWWGDSTGSFSVPAPTGDVWTIPAGATLAQQQAILGCVPAGKTVTYSGNPAAGGVVVSANNVTINLNGATVGPGSPAFTITGDDVTLMNGILDGNGTDPGVLVMDGADNFILQNMEIKNWRDGVEVAGAHASLKLMNNWIHRNTGDGIKFNAGLALSGVVTINGNLLKENGGAGISNLSGVTVPAAYNSWGHVDGPASGDHVYGPVTDTPYTFSEMFVDVTPNTAATERHVNELDIFDVAVKVDAKGLYAVQYKLTYDPNYLTLQDSDGVKAGVQVADGPFKGTGTCTQAVAVGSVSVYCTRFAPDVDGDGILTVSTLTFKADGVGRTFNGPWNTYFDLSVAGNELSSAARDGIKIFVNNGGFDDPSATAGRTITDTPDDGKIIIDGLANYTGYVDLQGRANDSGALVTVYNQAPRAAAPVYANDTTISSGKYTTAYAGVYQLVIGQTYWFQVDRALYLPTTAMIPADWAHFKQLGMRPLTTLGTVMLLGGDAFNDNMIDMGDASCIGSNFGTSATSCGGGSLAGSSPDVNEDAIVDILDLVLMGGNYDKTASPWTP